MDEGFGEEKVHNVAMLLDKSDVSNSIFYSARASREAKRQNKKIFFLFCHPLREANGFKQNKKPFYFAQR